MPWCLLEERGFTHHLTRRKRYCIAWTRSDSRRTQDYHWARWDWEDIITVIELMDNHGMGKCWTVLGSPDEENRQSVVFLQTEKMARQENREHRICPFDSALCDLQQSHVILSQSEMRHVHNLMMAFWGLKRGRKKRTTNCQIERVAKLDTYLFYCRLDWSGWSESRGSM